MTSLLGKKIQQGQKFLENGQRIPVTYVNVAGNTVITLKTADKDNYFAAQMGLDLRKKSNKAMLGHIKGAGLKSAPKFLKEIRLSSEEGQSLPNIGDVIIPSEVLKPGDVVNVTGVSKGKGFAGGVKRHGFHGGPKTHGQSDRHRAPGAIGQGTTPGRVYKGKRMAGRMGQDNVTVRNLKIVDVDNDQVLIKGLVPGVLGSYIVIKKVGEDKKFTPLYKELLEADQAPQEEKVEEPKEEIKAEEIKIEPAESNKEPRQENKKEEIAENASK